MKVILSRLWFEPAVVIGLLTSAALAYITGFDTTDEVLTSLAPLAASLGIRQLVSPTTKINLPADTGDGLSEWSQKEKG